MLVLSHGGCLDGQTAAWSVAKAHPTARLVPAFFGTEPPEVVPSELVVIVDFSYPVEVMRRLAAKASAVVWLDHHESSLPWMEEIVGPLTPGQQYDSAMAEVDGTVWSVRYGKPKCMSGAGLAWDYFHPLEAVPKLVQYVQDIDLWNKSLPYCEEISAYISSWEFVADNWERTYLSLEHDFDKCLSHGHSIRRKMLRDLSSILKSNSRKMTIGGHEVKVANVPYSLASDAGNKLCRGGVFGATYCDQRNTRKFSLRSSEDGGLNVSEIAKQYGGGGHKNSAGFHVPFDKLVEMGLL